MTQLSKEEIEQLAEKHKKWLERKYSNNSNNKSSNIPQPHELLAKPLFWVILVAIISAVVLIFAIPFPYTATEAYIDQVPYSASESYTEWVSSNNCNYESGCYCYHYSWGGLGSCDSCKCTRYRTVTRYQGVTKERPVTKYATAYQQWTGQVKWWYRV